MKVNGFWSRTRRFGRIAGMASFGYYLKRLRAERGISLRDLEKEVGISHNTLALYEKEHTVPSVENGFAIAEYFGLPLEFFLKGETVISDFSDATLRDLCWRVDAMSDEDRTLAKDYLSRLVNNRDERDELEREALRDK
jgi:transcriptional regulator with XRE-family HTH domain